MVPSCHRQNVFTQELNCGSSVMGGHMGHIGVTWAFRGNPWALWGGLVGLVGVVWAFRGRGPVGLVGSPMGPVGCHVV